MMTRNTNSTLAPVEGVCEGFELVRNPLDIIG